MKQKRNDVCECGSGKKYKKCCFLSGPTEKDVDLWTYCCFLFRVKGNYYKEYPTIIKNYHDLFFIKKDQYGISESKYLVDRLEILEKEIMKLVGKYTTYELLFFYQRMSSVSQNETGDFQTQSLYRRVMFLSILKYGKDEIIGALFINKEEANGYSLPKRCEGLLEKISEETLFDEIPEILSPFLRDLYNIEILCSLYIKVTQLYRLVEKGEQLTFTDSGIPTIWTKETMFLTTLYDNRLEYITCGTTLGVHIGLKQSDSKELPFLVIQKNTDELTTLSVYTGTNFDLIPIYMDELQKFSSKYDQLYREKYNVSLSEILNFLKCLSFEMILHACSDPIFFSKGYSLYSKSTDMYIDSLFIFSKKKGYGLSREVIKKIYELYFYRKKDNSVSLWDKLPMKLFIPIGNNDFIILYEQIIPILLSITDEFKSLNDSNSHIKSKYFEESISTYLQNTPGVTILLTSEEILNKLGKKREIDFCFIYKNILFICECKSKNLDSKYDRGVSKELNERKRYWKDCLQQVESVAKFIKNNKNDFKQIIKDSKYIIPLVISAYPEYIWSDNPELFLSDELPRILTPSELTKISKLNYSEIINRNYCIKL